MIVDIKTVLILLLIVNIINAGAMAVIWHRYRKRFSGLSFWLADMGLQAAGVGLILLRGTIPDFFSIVIANSFLISSMLILFIGLEYFVGVKGPQIHNYLIIGMYVIGTSYFYGVQPNVMMRTIIISAVSIIFGIQICYLIFQRTPHNLREITQTVGFLIGGYVIVSAFRIIFLLVFPVGTNNFFKTGVVDEMAMILYLSLNICLIITLLLMVTRRLLGEVQYQEEKFTKAFLSSPYAILITNASDGEILEVNRGFTRISGYHPHEVIGKTTRDLPLWVRNEDREEILQELSEQNMVQWKEIQFRRKNGDYMTGLFSAEKILIRNNICILSSFSDITDRKRAENALRQANRQLNLLTSITRHDINNNIQVILCSLEMMQENSPEPKNGDLFLRMKFAIQAIWTQIEFTKIYQDLGTHESQWQAIDSVLPVSQIPGSMTLHSHVHGIQIFADPMLEKVFFNLLDNSIRHGQRVSEIRVSYHQKDENLVIIWEDNGIGIPHDEKELIFKRGYGKNTGLGMFLVREILSITGICIAETGVSGKGARFEMTIPKDGYRLDETDRP